LFDITFVTGVAANGAITYVFKGLFLPANLTTIDTLVSGGYFNRLALVTRKC
jgi:hypothetical protein